MSDVLFSSANIAALSAKFMLNKERIRNMISATSIIESLKILEDCGYEIVPENINDDDKIIEDERTKTQNIFNQLCTDDALLFCINEKYNYQSKPPTNENVIKLYESIEQYIPNIKSTEIMRYFRCEIDILNMRYFAKCRIAKADKNPLALVGGTLNYAFLKTILTSDIDAIRNAFAGTDYSSFAYLLIRDDLSAFETASENFLFSLCQNEHSEIYSNMPLFYWYILKQSEFRAVKTILMGKRFDFSKKTIMDNLRGVYERF